MLKRKPNLDEELTYEREPPRPAYAGAPVDGAMVGGFLRTRVRVVRFDDKSDDIVHCEGVESGRPYVFIWRHGDGLNKALSHAS